MRYRAQRMASGNKVCVRVGENRQIVEIVNVSTSGARLVAPDGIYTSAMLRFELLSGDAPARVIWVRDGEAGVHFVLPLSDRQLAEMRKTNAARAAPAHAIRKTHGFRELH